MPNWSTLRPKGLPLSLFRYCRLIVLLTALFIAMSTDNRIEASPPFDRVKAEHWAHFFGSAYLTEYSQSRGTPTGTVVLEVGAIGLGKEIYDSWICKQPWEWEDLWADFLGIGLGLIVN